MFPIPEVQSKHLQNEKTNFSLFFPRMVSWRLKDGDIVKNDNAVAELHCKSDKKLGNAQTELDLVHRRQRAVLKSRNELGIEVFEFRAVLSSRYVSGLGAGHPTETGMILDRNTGMPFIPANGIKGVLRLAHSLNLDKSECFDKKTWLRKGFINKRNEFQVSENGDHVMVDDKEPSLRKYFGDTATKSGCVRGQIVFLDAFPETVPELKTDIMNPHFKSYYKGPTENEREPFKGPMETESPLPIKFLTVEKETVFIFRCFVSPLLPPEKPDGVSRNWTEEDSHAVEAMFRKALVEIGMGAKTAVGYGRFGDFENRSLKLKEEWDSAAEIERKRKKLEEEKKRLEEERRQKKIQEAEQEEFKQKALENFKAQVEEKLGSLGASEDKKEQKKIEKQRKFLEFVKSVLDGNPIKDEAVITSITDGILCQVSTESADEIHKCAAEGVLKIMNGNKKWLKANGRRSVLNRICS